MIFWRSSSIYWARAEAGTRAFKSLILHGARVFPLGLTGYSPLLWLMVFGGIFLQKHKPYTIYV